MAQSDRRSRCLRLRLHERAAAAIVIAFAAASVASAAPLPLEDFSPSFLGMYRKVMVIEDDIRRHADRYGVDVDLAWAVCMYESGGNAGLASRAGALGYFQVMPRTYRALKVTTNIEAGIKYLAQMIQQFGREDRAIAAYNGGPGRVGRAGGLPLETLQYVVGVGHYRMVLKQFQDSVRHHASQLQLTSVRSGEDWPAIAARIGIPVWDLRLHNPFQAGRQPRAGELVAYPPAPRRDLMVSVDGGAAYRMRHGDNYIKLSIALGVEPEAVRLANGLWQIQALPAGFVLNFPLAIDRRHVIRAVLADLGGGLPAAAAAELPQATLEAAADEEPEPLVVALNLAPPAAPALDVVEPDLVHRVQRGETLSAIARRYGTSVSAIQRENGLRGPRIHVGQRLRIPRGGSPEA